MPRPPYTISRFLDTSARFPAWCATEEQRERMTSSCSHQLAHWRFTVAYHSGLASVEQKLRHRRHLEHAYNELKALFEIASAA